MKRIYDYVCKKCWHQWKAYKECKKCPKCGNTNLDEESELKEE